MANLKEGKLLIQRKQVYEIEDRIFKQALKFAEQHELLTTIRNEIEKFFLKLKGEDINLDIKRLNPDNAIRPPAGGRIGKAPIVFCGFKQ